MLFSYTIHEDINTGHFTLLALRVFMGNRGSTFNCLIFWHKEYHAKVKEIMLCSKADQILQIVQFI